MEFYRTLIIIGLFSSFTFNVLSNNAKEMLFTSPIIYRPVIDLALSRNTKPLNKRQRTKIPEFKITMIISDFVPDNKDKEQFDSFVQISFKEIENIKIIVFKKDNFVQQLYVVRKEGASETVVKHKRDIGSLLSKVLRENKAYFDMTRNTFLSILKREDFLTDLPEGEHILTFNIEALTDVVMGKVYFSKLPYRNGFCYYKNNLENSALIANKKPLRIKFSVTYFTNYIRLANLFDEKILNGFECYFYPNQGLKYLTDLRNGKQMDVTVWSPNGENEKKISFKEWLKLLHAPKIVAYFPGVWLSDVLTLKGYGQESACYWDEATKSPRYEIVLSTSGGSFLCQFNFSTRLKLTDALFEKMLKERKNSCVGNTVFESPVSFKSEIGSKSFGISQDGITKEIVFLRDNLVLHIKSVKGNDVRKLASELDKLWQNWNSSQSKSTSSKKEHSSTDYLGEL